MTQYLIKPYSSALLAFAMIFAPMTIQAAPVLDRDKIQVQEESNFQKLAIEMQQRGLPVLVEFHADHCPYCRQLEREFLRPMLLSGDYEDKIIIRQVEMDYATDIIDFQGNKVSASDFANRYKAYLAPTMVFLNARGEEVAEKIEGINTPALFGGYIDEEIEKALNNVRAESPSR